jgi:hypothetical protein
MLPDQIRKDALEAQALLGPFGVSIPEAARYYVEHMELAARSETVANAFDLFMAAKSTEGLSPRYLTDLRYCIARFAGSFGERKLSEVRPAEIDQWLRCLNVAPLTHNSYYLRLRVLFEFARQQGWVNSNPMDEVPKATQSRARAPRRVVLRAAHNVIRLDV